MRKSFTILTGILVCALTATGAMSSTLSPTAETAAPTNYATFAPAELAKQITEARQLLQESSAISADSVRLAALDSTTGELTTLPLSKDEFLKKDAKIEATTAAGDRVSVRIVRANGVNTAVTISDASTGESLLPLVVQYPIVRGGAVTEIAYYTSAHPALLSSELNDNGQSYIR